MRASRTSAARASLTAATAAAALAALLAFGPSPAASANGCITPAAGTANDPYLINNLDNLLCLRNNGGYYWAGGKHFRQTADIDLTGQAVWDSAIGTDVAPFTGTYDGDGHEITGLQVDLTGNSAPLPTSNAGLFGYTNGATISDLQIDSASVSITPSGVSAGTLVGSARNTQITNVHSSGTVAGGQDVGGLVGYGGLGTKIDSSSSSATVTGNGWCAGGLLGCGDLITISDSHSSGAVTGDTFVGGLVGGIWAPGTVTRSWSSGAATNPLDTGGSVGGLIGLAVSNTSGRVAISKSFASGAATDSSLITGDGGAGGLVGVSVADNGSSTNQITDSYASGEVTANKAAGGLVGRNKNGSLDVSNSYSRSAVRGPASAVGGILGFTTAGTPTVTNSFWNPTDADNPNVNAVGAQSTQAAMKTIVPYSTASWDISDDTPTTKTWASCPANNDGYPFLAWYASAQGWSCETEPVENSPGEVPTDKPSPRNDSGSASNAFRAKASRISGSTIRTRITVPGPGRLSQRATRSRGAGAGAAARLTVCRTSKVAGKAGTYTLTCKANRATRKARRRGVVRVKLQTTFAPTGGSPRTTSRRVTLSSSKPSYTG